MSDTLDSRLIVSLLNSGKGHMIYELGINSDMFEIDARPVFHMVENHFRQHNKLPSKKELIRHYPTFQLRKATEPLVYYAQELINRFRFRQFKETIGSAVEELNSEEPNLDKALDDATNKLAMIKQCGATSASDYTLRGDSIEANIARKKHMAAEFSFGFDALDKDLIGMDRGNLTLLAGPPGMGKSWLLLQMAYNNWCKGNNVLVISLEMPTRVIEDRLDAIWGKLNYDKYRRGLLTTEEEVELTRKLKGIRKADNFFKLISFENYDIRAKARLGSVESIQACVQRYKPDFLYVDGVYLGMSMQWEEATKFANDFHAMLVATRMPCVATTQMKQDSDEAKPKLRDLAFTAGFQHAASYVLMCGRDGEGAASNLTMHAVKVREAQDRTSYFVNFKPATCIELESMVQAPKNLLYDDEEDEECD